MQLAIYSTQPHPNPWFAQKVIGWIKRYLPAKVAGTTAAILGTTLAWQLDQSLAVTALAGTWCEVVGFYLAMMIQEWRNQRPHSLLSLKNRQSNYPLERGWQARIMARLTSVRQTIGFLAQILRTLVAEFGPAELVDPFLLRPALLALAMHLIPGAHWAVLIGKVAADLIFYTVAISSFELRQKLATKKFYNNLSQL